MSKTTSKKPTSNSLIIMVIVGVLVGWIVGFAIGTSLAEDNNKSSVGSSSSEEVTGDPAVEITANEDSKGGYNVNIVTENFVFTPENAGGENVENQGHAHIYVDGKKLGRVYGDWYYVAALPEGEHEIKVSLNGNDHSDIVVNGQPVYAKVMVSSDGMMSDHVHSDGGEDHSH